MDLPVALAQPHLAGGTVIRMGDDEGRDRQAAEPPDVVTLVSYLSPGLPEEMFELIGSAIARQLDTTVQIGWVHDRSGPRRGESDPFDGADLLYVCGPSYVELRNRGEARLVPIGLVFEDPRNGGAPRYFSDVVVRSDSPATGIGDLHDEVWAVNDDRSLSGFGCVVDAIGPHVSAIWSGSHSSSVDLVLEGEAACAAIDANHLRRTRPPGLRVVHTFGPHPIQPLVVRPDFPHTGAVVRALLDCDLSDWDVVGVGPLSDDDYPDSLDSPVPTFRAARARSSGSSR